nr:hypothetical protein [uncultured Allomuricauda sp.]
MKKIQNPFSPQMVEQIKAGLERYDSLQKKDGFIKLAELGWYINGSMTLAHSAWLMDMAIENEIEKINRDLLSHYKEEMLNRVKFLAKSKSKRYLIIKEAIECHLLGKYHASVALFLSQADGLSNGLLFITRNNKKDLKKFVAEEKGNKFFGDILDAILRINKIDEYFSKELHGSTELNRHAVLHGYDTDFGTELNSLKAYSLLLFVDDFLENPKM